MTAAGRVRDVPAERITNVLSDMLYGRMFTNYFVGSTRPPEEQAREIFDIAFYGILSDSERTSAGSTSEAQLTERQSMTRNRTWTRYGIFGLGTFGAALVLAVIGVDRVRRGGDIDAAEPAAATVPSTSSAAGATERSVAVSLVPITVRSVQRAVSAVGSFYGYDEVTVMAEVSGVVAKVYYDVGDMVKPGDVAAGTGLHGPPIGRGRNPAGPGIRGDPDRRER